LAECPPQQIGDEAVNVLVFGATGGTGRALVAQALQRGHVVTAFARDPAKVGIAHEKLHVAKGNILDYDAVKAAARNQDVAVSALGVRPRVGAVIFMAIACQLLARLAGLSGPLGWLVGLGLPLLAILIAQRRTITLSEGTKNIVRAMEELGVRRLVCQSSLGIGDSREQLGFLYQYIMIPMFLRHIFADKELQEKVIKGSKVQWVIVRPGALTNGSGTGNYRSWTGRPDAPIRRRISRADTADFMLRQLGEDTYLAKTPGLSY
jgi:putative NADH-flavin reductase